MVVLNFVFNNCSRALRVECVLNPDRNVFDSDRVDGGRVYYFSPEITKFHRLNIAKFVNGIG